MKTEKEIKKAIKKMQESHISDDFNDRIIALKWVLK